MECERRLLPQPVRTSAVNEHIRKMQTDDEKKPSFACSFLSLWCTRTHRTIDRLVQLHIPRKTETPPLQFAPFICPPLLPCYHHWLPSTQPDEVHHHLPRPGETHLKQGALALTSERVLSVIPSCPSPMDAAAAAGCAAAGAGAAACCGSQ